MYVSSRISVQTHIAKRCDVVAKMKINSMKLIFISAQANICLLNVKRSGRSQNVFTHCGGVRLQKNNGVIPLLESISS
jgi:hypothetical protein